MKELARPVLAALGRALAAGGSSALDPAVPAALWRRALVEPATDFLARPGKALRATIVRAGWTLGGGAPDATPDGLALPLELLHAGSLIVDDVEDGATERRGAPALHHVVGVPLAINTGSWMYFWALAELAALELPGALELATRALVRCHQGQALDLATRVTELDAADAPRVVEAITRAKTGALCRLAGELGAIAAGASPEARAAIGAFAEAAGVALQMLDDLGSVASPARRAKGHEDLRAARATWPWAWLAEQEPAAWARATAALAVHDDLDALADGLAAATAATGRARIRDVIDRALAEVTGAVGQGPAVAEIAAELERMEASYG